MIFIGVDDTDNKESGGTGRIARSIAAVLREQFPVLGVSRHQLLVDDRIPYTSNNSCNVIHLLANGADTDSLATWVSRLLVERCLVGSDPGLCIALAHVAGHPFGQTVQTRVVSQAEAREAASELKVILRPLGGTGDGIIGALAGVILAAGGNDGRFVDVGTIRDLDGTVSVEQLLAAGVSEVRTLGGELLTRGAVDTNGGRVRPMLRDHRPVLLVEPTGENGWRVVELGRAGHKPKERRACKPL
jgi:hypothetical protein